MQGDELERIRLLQNRMRRQSKNGNHLANNEESLKSIKSTDSKKVIAHSRILQERQEERGDERGDERRDQFPEEQNSELKVLLSEEQMKKNRKITDYFPGFIPHPSKARAFGEAVQPHSGSPALEQEQKTSIANQANSPENKNKSEIQALRQENRLLRERVRQRDEVTAGLKEDIVEMTIKTHKTHRNELRLRVNTNKIRIGEYYADRKGRQSWVDGTEIREVREKIEAIIKEKEALEKSKKSARKHMKEYHQDPEEWKNSLTSQCYFLSREESHLQELLRRLEEEKTLHIKQCKMLFEEEHSKYGRLESRSEGNGWKKIKKYQLLGLLGKGGFSEVYKAFDIEDLKEVACKVHQFHPGWETNAKENYVRHAVRENNVHRVLQHPNIVRLYDTVEIDSNSFCTVLEYCQGPDLSHYLKKHKKIPEKEAKMILRQVVNAIKYLHELPDKVIHYDLKPQNIMFHKGRIKITDFGLCKTTKEDIIELTSQGVGTYWYLPPECFETDKKAVITPKVDIWSIGVIYYEMLYGEKPFGNQMSQMRILHEGIMLKASTVNFPITQKGLISNESKDFIKECLQFKVEQRIDIKAVANHKLFEKK